MTQMDPMQTPVFRNWREASEHAQKLRLRCLAPQLHRLGEGPLFHFLCELAAGADVLSVAETYAGLPADFIAAYGGDRLPPHLTLVASEASLGAGTPADGAR
jgi:hypothetical protein